MRAVTVACLVCQYTPPTGAFSLTQTPGNLRSRVVSHVDIGVP